MPVCEHGPDNGPGCDQDLLWVAGVAYSKHFAPSHFSRVNRRKSKPKKNELGLAGNATEAEVHAALKKLNQELEQGGKVG